MERIEFNDLSKWSKWPAYMLGLAPWTIPSRTIEKVSREYDDDKYAKCFDFYSQADAILNPQHIRDFQLGGDVDRQVCISLGDDLYKVAIHEAAKRYSDLVLQTLEPHLAECATIIELGCGFGYNLWLLEKHFSSQTFLGADYSRNAEGLANELYRENPNINVCHFNFYDSQTYSFLDMAKPPFLIFTSHAIEQLPNSQSVFDALLPYRQKIKTVVHFEPIHQSHPENLIGMMRHRYTEMNDYNVDLLAQLQARPYIRVKYINANVMGLNPLNPTSAIEWEFC